MMFVEVKILTYSSNISLHKLINQIVIFQVHIIHMQNVDCKFLYLLLLKIFDVTHFFLF